jgi:Putative transposase
MHVLPKGLHRIRYYGLLANGNRAANLATMHALLGVAVPKPEACGAPEATTPEPHLQPCPCCGGQMRIILFFQAGFMPRIDAAAPAVIRIDTS